MRSFAKEHEPATKQLASNMTSPSREAMYEAFPILELLLDSDDPPLTPEVLEELQSKLGFRFPQDYADFLLCFNGGWFYRSVRFSIPQPTLFVTGAHLCGFNGEPRDGIRHNGILWTAEMLSDRIPPEYLPIAYCNGRDLLLLKFENQKTKFAGVWFWDSEAFFISEETQAAYWLADSFSGFLSMLVYDFFPEEDEEHETIPIFQAIERGNLLTVKRCLTEWCAIETRNAKGHTLLTAAVIHQWPRIAGLLLEHGADPNARDKQGQTVLHHAACHSIDCVKLLLAAGADPEARDNQGKSVLGDWSYRADQILRAHGAEE